MATQTLEFSAGTGLTLSCKLFALGSDTVVDTQTATEKTNDLNRYSVAFTDIPAGAYRLNAFVGAVGGFANEVYDLTLETATFSPRSESAGLDAEGVRTAVGLASANLDTQLSTIDTVVDNIEFDTQDIQSRLPASLTGGLMQAYVVGASNSGGDSISSRIATNIVDGSYSWPAALGEIADAVYDEPYAGHTTAGTYGFLWDKWRKSNPTITGEVTAAITPTTTTFSTDITGYADTAFDNAVLVFINGSTNADFRGVVSGYLQANGQVTITPALPQAPVAGDEFVIAITSFVYTLAQTQSGLATSAGVTAAFTEIKGATWDSGTDTLEAIRNASAGGSITITAGAANAPARSDDTNLIAFVDETISQALAIYEADGTTAKDMSGKTLTVVFENLETTDTAVVPSGSITVSGANNNTVTWAYPSAVTANVGTYRYALRDAAAPKTVYAQGLLFVKVAAAVDS